DPDERSVAPLAIGQASPAAEVRHPEEAAAGQETRSDAGARRAEDHQQADQRYCPSRGDSLESPPRGFVRERGSGGGVVGYKRRRDHDARAYPRRQPAEPPPAAAP